MKRKIIGLCLCAFLLTGLVACGKKEVESTSSVEIVEDDNKKTYNDDLKLFKEFYSKFYDEHRDFVDNKGNVIDCFSKIIINDNKTVMAIVDVIEEGKLFDLYLFETDGKKVIEKAKMKDVSTCYMWGDMNFISVDDNLFVTCREYKEDDIIAHIYKVDNNDFVQIYNNKVGIDEDGFYNIVEDINTGLGKNGTEGSFILRCNYGPQKYYDWILYDDDYFVKGTDFETLLDNMINEKIRDNTDILFCYFNYIIKKEGDDADTINDVFVLYWENGIYFELYKDGTAKVSSFDAGYENTEIPDKVNGYKVDLTDYQKQINIKEGP